MWARKFPLHPPPQVEFICYRLVFTFIVTCYGVTGLPQTVPNMEISSQPSLVVVLYEVKFQLELE